MDPSLTSKENGTELFDEEAVKSCCHPETNGVENAAFEAATLASSEPYHGHSHKEEIGLQGMNYKPLCSCDESGTPCQCGKIQQVELGRKGMREIRSQPWGKWKCVALSIILILTCIWIIVFVSLLLTGVI